MVLIEILSVSKKKETDNLPEQADELRARLSEYGFTLSDVKKTLMNPILINKTLDSIAAQAEKPDVVIIANALRTKDSKSFRKYFVETVVASERSENEPAPKDYWKKRNKAFADAKAQGADSERLEELEKEFTLSRKKAKVFTLGDFGNGYRGYCFMYKGVRVAAVPLAELTGEEFSLVASLAAVRTTEVFENPENKFADGFTDQDYVPAKTGFVNRFIPLKGDSRAEIGRKLLVIAAFLVFLGALAMLFYNMVFLSVKNTKLNNDIQIIAHGDESSDQAPDKDKDEEKGDGINWEKLKSINKEIVGWIQINDTKIDYPVLWHKGDDINYQYYLNHNYKGEYDSYGTVFVDYRCAEGTDSKNVVLHGHHMNDGSMFGNLMYYGGTTGDLDFYKKAPVIKFDTPKGDGVYKIISVFKTNTLSSHGEFFNYMIGDFQNDKDFMNYVYNVRVRSLINCPVSVSEDDELITLSTCSYEYTNFRTVVVARKVRIGESAEVDIDKASLNDNAVWPQVYYSARGGTRPEVTDFDTAYKKKQIDWYDGDYSFKDQKVTSSTTAPPTTAKLKDTTAGETRVTEPEPTKLYYRVEFINYDGSSLSVQLVEAGQAATAPPDPVKPSDEYFDYVFKGWQFRFDDVHNNMVNAPIFEPVAKPAN